MNSISIFQYIRQIQCEVMKFTLDKKELFVVLKVESEKLNTLNAPDLKSEFVGLVNAGYRNMILDLSSVSFIDSSGLSAILVGNRLCKESGGTFVLTSLHPNVYKLVQISQLDSILNTLPTVQEASDYIKMDELTRQISGNEEE